MTRRHREVSLRGTIALLAAFAVLAPGAAWAHGGSDRHDRHHHGHRDGRVPVYYHGDSCSRVHASHHRHRVRHQRRHHQARYACRPCGHRFDTRRAFHDHLHHRHRVARWLLPYVVFQSALGWVFYG